MRLFIASILGSLTISGNSRKRTLLELLSELCELSLQIFDFAFEISNSIDLRFLLRFRSRVRLWNLSRKQMCIAHFFLSGLSLQAYDVRGLARHERVQDDLHFIET